MVAVVHEVGCGRRLYRGARDQRSLDHALQEPEELLAGFGNHAMLLQAPGDRQLHRGVALDEAGERHILARMVKAVRVVSQVVDDVEHQGVVRLLPRVEGDQLPFQQVEKSGEIDVVGMPGGDRFGHVKTPATPSR